MITLILMSTLGFVSGQKFKQALLMEWGYYL